jgi:ZIP family zinc transporter
MLLIIGILATLFTFLGGLFAVHLKDKLHLVLGFSGGAVISIVFFDLLPEAFEIGAEQFSTEFVTAMMAFGFLLYMVFDRIAMTHSHQSDEHAEYAHAGHGHHHNPKRGRLGASALSLHSFLDGFIIGLAFQVSVSVGTVVAIAVLVHGFSDGINTVNFIFKSGGTKKEAFKWLAIDAASPLLGMTSTLLFTFPEKVLGVVLALFCGSFLYIGASELVPESYHAHPTRFTTFMTILGVLVMYIAIRLIGA